jgi:hypothetical protein
LCESINNLINIISNSTSIYTLVVIMFLYLPILLSLVAVIHDKITIFGSVALLYLILDCVHLHNELIIVLLQINRLLLLKLFKCAL